VAAIHAALTVPFSLLHVGGMVAIRKAVYAPAGSSYDFSRGVLARELFYEWRKDVLTYALLAATYFAFQRYAEVRSPPEGDQRIEIRDGGSAVFLAAGDILLVEAAGNYVTFHTPARSHLVRGTLAAWEARLTRRGFVRVHRGRLVNRSHIASIKPTPSGDIEITLDDGRVVAGSRRFRSALDSPSPTQRAP
jgi:DNA-binding LytR/AlgR family response regulator